MQSSEGFPLPERLLPGSDCHSPNLSKRLRKLQLTEMKLRMLKLDNNLWLQRRGKKQYVGFTPRLKLEAKHLFSALDTDGSGAISVDELYQPMLASGLVENKSQVQTLFPKSSSVKLLEFKEFLQLLETGKHDGSPVGQLVTEYILRKQDGDRQHLPHQVLISTSRRKLMLQAYRGETQASKDRGMKVLKAFSSELKEQPPIRGAKMELLKEKRRLELSRKVGGGTFRGSKTARLPTVSWRESWPGQTCSSIGRKL